MALLNLNSPQLAAGIGILAFRQLSGIAAFHKIVTRFYFENFIASAATIPHTRLKKMTNTGVYIPRSSPK